MLEGSAGARLTVGSCSAQNESVQEVNVFFQWILRASSVTYGRVAVFLDKRASYRTTGPGIASSCGQLIAALATTFQSYVFR